MTPGNASARLADLRRALDEAWDRPAAGRKGPLAYWPLLGRLGLMGLPFPRKFGGQAWSLPETAAALEFLGTRAGFTSLTMSLGAQMWGVQSPLQRFGTSAQKRDFLAPLCRGRAMAFPAVTEENAGSDILSMATEARREGAGYVLSGRKTFVTEPSRADFFLVWGRLAGRRGPMSLSCFIVPRSSRGLRTTTARWSTGPRGALTGSIVLRGCKARAQERLGRDGQGLAVFMHAMTRERRFILAPAVGAMERLLERTLARARTREQFGRPIGSFQAIAHRLADMRIRLEACRALMRTEGEAAAELESAAITKAFVSEAWVLSCLDAMEIFGARGCAEAWIREELDAALASRIMSGTNEIQRNLIASKMGLRL